MNKDKTRYVISRDLLVKLRYEEIEEFAYEEMENNDDWIDGYTGLKHLAYEEIFEEKFEEFVELYAQDQGWELV